MRILHLVHQYMPEYIGGTELYTQWTAHAQAKRGHQVSIFYHRSARGVGCDERAENGVRVWAAWNGVLTPTRRFLLTFGDPPLAQHFERVLDEFAPDLVHVEHLMGLPVALVHAIRRRRLPYVITLHDFWWICPNAQLLTNDTQQICDGPRAYLNCARCTLARVGRARLWPATPPLVWLLAGRNHLLRRVVQNARLLIAPTDFVGRWYTAHQNAAQCLVTLPHGSEQPAALIRHERTHGPVRFAYIGGLSWQKGVHVLVEAFSQVSGAAELWIAGDESFDPGYVARLHAQAMPKVRFLGRLSREAVWETLTQVDVVLVPSLWYETFSFIVSEAFIAGMPVIASRLGPLADRIRDGVDGLLLPPGDVAAWQIAMQQLVDEPDLLARLRANVHPPMTLEEHVDQVESLYAQIIAENRETR